MSSPRVTVVTATHNHARWLESCLASVAGQDHFPTRMVVVDDGSTDDTQGVLRKLLSAPTVIPTQSLPEPLRVVEQAWTGSLGSLRVLVARYGKAGGPARARNWAIQAAWPDTDLFSFLDSDDYYLPGRMEAMVRPFVEHGPVIGLVYSDYETLNPGGMLVRQWKPPYSRQGLVEDCIVSFPCIVRKEALAAVGLFDEKLRVAEDYDLWLRVTEKYLAYHIPRALVRLRVGGHSSTATVPVERWHTDRAEVYRKLRQRLGETA